jgi:hypothetical protein
MIATQRSRRKELIGRIAAPPRRNDGNEIRRKCKR